MRVCAAVAFMAIVSNTSAEQSAGKLLNDLKSKRETLSGVHQEFESTQTFTSTHGTQTSHQQIVIDVAGKKWRERSVSGAGNRVRIFDGNDLFAIEDEHEEYVRVKRKDKDKDKEKDREPAPYGSFDLDWAKAKEVGRQSCGFATVDHTCIVFEVPVKGWVRMGQGTHMTRMTGGVSRLAIDGENGLLIQSNTEEAIDDEKGGYRLQRTFLLKGLRYGKASDPALFMLPTTGMREVKEFTRWDASRIRKQLAGKPAPELGVTDIKGKPVSLSALKGKTVPTVYSVWCNSVRCTIHPP